MIRQIKLLQMSAYVLRAESMSSIYMWVQIPIDLVLIESDPRGMLTNIPTVYFGVSVDIK